MSYVGLVRGINVGASTRVGMPDLRACFEANGFTDVKTLLQSGNVVCDGPELADRDLSGRVTSAIETDFAERTGLAARFILLSAREFRRIAGGNPLAELVEDPSRMMIDFLPEPVALANLDVPDPDVLLPEVIAIGDREVYAWCPFGVTGSRIPPKFWRQFGPVATTRNLNTVNRIVAALDDRDLAADG